MNPRVERFFTNPFPLAPMDGYTSSPFRHFMRKLGCGFVVTEFVAADEIRNRSRKTQRRIAFREEERPLGIQIYGNDATLMRNAAVYVEQLGADFVDFNFGCPAKFITRVGKGAAWLARPSELGKLLEETRKSVSIPLTIKVRTGFESRNLSEILHVAENSGVDWITVHGRTAREAYWAQVDWNWMAETVSETKLPVIANGDIRGPGHPALKLLENGTFAALMIGRGCLQDPGIFLRLRGLPVPPLSEILHHFRQSMEEELPSGLELALTLARFGIHWVERKEKDRAFRAQLFARARESDADSVTELLLERVSGAGICAPSEDLLPMSGSG